MAGGRLCRQLTLVGEMIGLEGGIMMEILFMIANLQTLSVPVWLTSIPGTVSATVGIFLIPALGVYMDKKASSTAGKAKILVFTSAIHLIGLAAVCAGNLIKLYEDGGGMTSPNSTVTSQGGSKVESSSTPYYAIIVMVGYACVDCGFDTTNCFLKTFALACTPAEDHSSIIVKNVLISSLGGCLISVLGAVGVGRLLTSGFDLDLDPSAVQAALTSGLCFVIVVVGLTSSILTGFCCPPIREESSDLEESSPLTSDSSELCTDDENFLNANLYLSRTRSRSFTGSCYVRRSLRQERRNSLAVVGTTSYPPIQSPTIYSAIQDIDSESPPDSPKSRNAPKAGPSSVVAPVNEKSLVTITLTKSNQGDNKDDEIIQEQCMYADKTDEKAKKRSTLKSSVRNFGRVVKWLKKYARQIILNAATFFIMGSMYAFLVYVPNFVGTAVYGGDPNAEVHTDEYSLYMKGIEYAGAGTLAFYAAFSVTVVVLQMAIDIKRMKIAMLVSSLIMAILSLALALTQSILVFFISNAWVGVYRAVGSTVPYILANQFALEQVGEKNSGLAISIVASMLPLGFALTSAVMGPLIDATGDSGAPLLYCSVTSFLGFFIFTFLK